MIDTVTKLQAESVAQMADKMKDNAPMDATLARIQAEKLSRLLKSILLQ